MTISEPDYQAHPESDPSPGDVFTWGANGAADWAAPVGGSTLTATPGQTDPVFDVQDENGDSLFTVDPDGSGLYPGWGKFTLTGLFGFPTFYDPTKTAWNDAAGATGLMLLRGTHHGGPEYDLFMYASSVDIQPGYVTLEQTVNAATLADGRASVADVDIIATSADGTKYVDADFNVSIRPDGTQHSAGLFIDTDTISPSFGISIDKTQAYLPAFAGQTTPLILLENTSGVQCFAVGVTGYVDLTEQTAPATPGANIARLYTKDVGGKTGLYVLFPSGAEQQIKVEV